MSGQRPISVSELVNAYKEVVETALPPATVLAEVSNCRRSSAGHYYLTLKDERSEIGAVIWRTAASRLKFEVKDGLQVLASGSLQVYVPRGSCQFIINRLQPQGLGELELAFRQLKQKLEGEGLFAPECKRPLPRLPRRIALVTSPTSAAVRDMIQVITRRWPAVRLLVVPVPVQGNQAAPQIARGIRAAAAAEHVDVIITGRGGGSLEDLWPFNEEVVARAIADSPVPVVSAVGHEIDVSIADLVADRRALTPSEAGELVVPSLIDLISGLRDVHQRLTNSARSRVERMQMQLEALSDRPVFQRPITLVNDRRQHLEQLSTRVEILIADHVRGLQASVATTAAALDALSPLKVLARGYSLTTTMDGTVLRSAADVEPGQRVKTRLMNGELDCTVSEVHD